MADKSICAWILAVRARLTLLPGVATIMEAGFLAREAVAIVAIGTVVVAVAPLTCF